MTTALLRIPAPAPLINANHRTHWAKKSTIVRTWRTAAKIHALANGLPHFGDQPVRITATVHTRTARSYDAANYAPTAKACVDGLRDAGVLVEDDNAHVIGPDMRAGEKCDPPCLVLLIEAVTE